MRFVKENSTHAEGVCSHMKTLNKLSHQTDVNEMVGTWNEKTSLERFRQ